MENQNLEDSESCLECGGFLGEDDDELCDGCRGVADGILAAKPSAMIAMAGLLPPATPTTSTLLVPWFVKDRRSIGRNIRKALTPTNCARPSIAESGSGRLELHGSSSRDPRDALGARMGLKASHQTVLNAVLVSVLRKRRTNSRFSAQPPLGLRPASTREILSNPVELGWRSSMSRFLQRQRTVLTTVRGR